VDASRVESIDASGIGVIVLAAKLAREAGGRLVLREPSQATRGLLELSGLEGSVSVERRPFA
jgi:anti-anti-sigma factor